MLAFAVSSAHIFREKSPFFGGIPEKVLFPGLKFNQDVKGTPSLRTAE
jgi:hypothetical protein